MKFGDALEAMKRGRPIRRAGWVADRYLQFNRGDVIQFHGRGRANAIIANKDILADDWELLNQPLSAQLGEPLGGIQQRTLAEVDRETPPATRAEATP